MIKRYLNAAVAVAFLGISACGDDDGGSVEAIYASNACVSAKQQEAGTYGKSVLDAWSAWDTSGDAAQRASAIQSAKQGLRDAWASAEAESQAEGTDCSDLALSSSQATGMIDDAVEQIVGAINDGLDLDRSSQAQCGADLLAAAATKCADVLAAEGVYVADPGHDSAEAALARAKSDANSAFASAWSSATGSNCPTTASQGGVSQQVDDLTDGMVLHTVVAANLDDEQYTTISPTGTTRYMGQDLTPVCIEGTPYHFFVKRGTVNKLVMYYQGGGACWEQLTCGVPVCDNDVNPDGGDNPNNFSSGFADRDNPDNPFRDWHTVFVSYCSCDVHYGDAAQDYDNVSPDEPLHIEHRGYHNARVAEKWAREHFVNPEVVFATGSSAGAYGAWFHGPLMHDAWPGSQFHILADAGNGVITDEFLQESFPNWNFAGNLPPQYPELKQVLEDGSGIPGYTEVAAREFPDTNWAHYSAAFDGGTGGQTGFYNVMLNDNNPIAALTWWDGSCQFNSVMREQAIATYDVVPENYRYYIGTGSRHTMWGNNKVYNDTTGGVPTIVDWIDAMLDSKPGARDPDWENIECTDCGLTLPGDPQPNPPAPPFEQQGDDIVIVCD
jgi:hypothetical protein